MAKIWGNDVEDASRLEAALERIARSSQALANAKSQAETQARTQPETQLETELGAPPAPTAKSHPSHNLIDRAPLPPDAPPPRPPAHPPARAEAGKRLDKVITDLRASLGKDKAD